MARVNLLLLAIAMVCALGVITAQHKARKLFVDLEAGQAAAKRLDEEFTQLQLEQSTWATNKRVEAIASKSLGMRLPEPGATRVITLGEPAQAAKP
ncbi:MAG: cell division protein FtsL [Betaproteobacteria bacterium]|nr:cell division protein FtsL [Betaproteobacteria bacterium]